MEIKKYLQGTLVATLIVGTGIAVSVGATKYNSLKKQQSLEQRIQKPLKSQIKSIDYKTNNFLKDSDKTLLARMIFGEARWCYKLEKIAVAYSAITRSRKWRRFDKKRKLRKMTLREVILQPKQYSCFNKKLYDKKKKKWVPNLNLERVRNPMRYYPNLFEKCLEVSGDILNGRYGDPTGGATNYYNPKLVEKPDWAKRAKRIGKIKVGIDKKGKPVYSAHVFCKL